MGVICYLNRKNFTIKCKNDTVYHQNSRLLTMISHSGKVKILVCVITYSQQRGRFCPTIVTRSGIQVVIKKQITEDTR